VSWPDDIYLPGGKLLVDGDGNAIVAAEDCCCGFADCPSCDSASFDASAYTLDPSGFTGYTIPFICPCLYVMTSFTPGSMTVDRAGPCCYEGVVGTAHIRRYADAIQCAADNPADEGDYDVMAKLTCHTPGLGGEWQLSLTAGGTALFSGLRSGSLSLDALTFTNTCTASAAPPDGGCSGDGPFPCCIVDHSATITLAAVP